MNDFTKEELEHLLSDCWSAGANYPGLFDKLKSMIENYCDHELAMVFSVTKGRILRCLKCERVFN